MIYLLQLYFHIRISRGKFVLLFSAESQLQKSRATQNYGACWVFEYFHNPPNSDMDHMAFNVRTYVNARGCTDTVKESVLTVDSGTKLPDRTGESNPRQRRAGSLFYQLSYSPSCHCAKLTVYFRYAYYSRTHYALPTYILIPLVIPIPTHLIW